MGHLGRPDIIIIKRADHRGTKGGQTGINALKVWLGLSGPIKDQARKVMPVWTRGGNRVAGLAACIGG